MEKYLKSPFSFEDVLYAVPSPRLRKGEGRLGCSRWDLRSIMQMAREVPYVALTKLALLLRHISAVLNYILTCHVKVKWQMIQFM